MDATALLAMRALAVVTMDVLAGKWRREGVRLAAVHRRASVPLPALGARAVQPIAHDERAWVPRAGWRRLPANRPAILEGDREAVRVAYQRRAAIAAEAMLPPLLGAVGDDV